MVFTTEEKKEMKRIANKKYREKNKERLAVKYKEYYEENKERLAVKQKEYYEENKEKINLKQKKYKAKNKEKIALQNKEYSKTPIGKKVITLSGWKYMGLIASKEELDRIYNLYLNQVFCNACDCVLTRNHDNSKTDANMDHDHSNGIFRHIICHGCNAHDNWKKHFC